MLKLPNDDANKFCKIQDLSNEASVEQFFVNRLLGDLGYKDNQIVPKASLSDHQVSIGRKKVNYKPDYALKYGRNVRWICDAKAVSEPLDKWTGQCSSYCLILNQGYSGNPVEYFLLTNGAHTRLYRWDSETVIMELAFGDFIDGNDKYEKLKKALAPEAFKKPAVTRSIDNSFTLYSRSIADLNADFTWAHNTIYKRENLSYSAAFMEFVKIIFLKLLSDREVRKSDQIETDSFGNVSIAESEVRFSKKWIEDRERDHPNPLDAIQFQSLLKNLESEIRAGTKKRIFKPDEHIILSSETIKALVERFEHTDLYAMDSDLNGRLFETFLNATLRGKALGQYFTPRSVVKLATQLARLRVGPNHTDIVVDACCGTGGFLIEALSQMWGTIDANASLSESEREGLRVDVATQRLFGIDVARDPALARIARINMYLHGDGGSRIYQLDSLSKQVRADANDPIEIKQEKDEFRNLLTAHKDGFADVVLTNPPFAKEYSRQQPMEGKLLDDYELAFDTSGGARRALPTLKSSVMFLERYWDILKPGGRLVTVIDDSILGADRHSETRAWIRKRFLVRAVVSLPGDAFQRSQARVKTSIVILEKRSNEADPQPSVFMYYCESVGVDDASRQRVLPVDELNRAKADKEIDRVSKLYADFLENRQPAKKWTVPSSRFDKRMDVKACLPQAGRRVRTWKSRGLQVVKLDDVIEPVFSGGKSTARAGDVIDTSLVDELVTHLRVRYDGFAEPGEEVLTSDSGYARLFKVSTGDLVLSHINAIHGAVAVVPSELQGLVITNEYTVFVTKDGIDPRLVWTLLRTPEARADLLLLSTGIGRTRITWKEVKDLQLPLPAEDQRKKIVNQIASAEKAERKARQLRKDLGVRVTDELMLDSETAQSIISAFKPPR